MNSLNEVNKDERNIYNKYMRTVKYALIYYFYIYFLYIV